MVRKGLRQVSWEGFQSGLGLEAAASLNRFNNMESYWQTVILMGNRDFGKVMGSASFKEVRANVRTYLYYYHDEAVENQIWYLDTVLDHLAENFAPVAVSIGVTSLDENTVRCKGKTSALSYITRKLIKFGIHFYVFS